MELSLQAMKTLSELMDHALDLDAAARTRWLADLATGPQAPLQPYLAEMLARQATMETAFLVSPVPLTALPMPADQFSTISATGLVSGAHIGPYVLEREIGVGGMGAVWLAARDDGVLKRRVALKLPMLHRTLALAERFTRERDILASLTHPHIARLYDAGVSASGQPYLALEYIEGRPITEHCDGIKLSVDERLRRFMQVAAAVQYAHANLVIHRDLKPSNILVSDDGQVHLLDFGIAKLLDDPKAQMAESELTMLAGRALTLDYASPEQVSGQAISIASDVYSLGVVLHQLLTGQKPYLLKRASRAELEEAILSGEAERMSDAVRRSDDSVAALRGLSRDRLARMLAGDLDTIVGKAMNKVPEQRYATVAAFAEDIQRHLDGLPVAAQPDSLVYRARKFVARHRLAASASIAVVVALTAGLGTALWQASVAREQARRADLEAATAKRETARGDAVQGYLVDLFNANSHDQKGAVDIGKLSARQLLDRGADKLETSSALSQDVNAVLFRLFGELYENLNEFERSTRLHERSVKAAEQAHGKESKQYALAVLELAWLQNGADGKKPPMALLNEAKDILRRIAPNGEEYAQALYFEAEFVLNSDPKRALIAATESVRMMQASGGSNRRKAFAERILGTAQRLMGDVDSAALSFASAATSFETLYGENGIETGITRGELATTLRLQLRLAEAEREARVGLEIMRTFHGDSVDGGGWGQRLQRLVAERGRIVEAESKLQSVYDRLAVKDGERFDRQAAVSLELARVAAARGDFPRALRLMQKHRAGIPSGLHTVIVSALSRTASSALATGNLPEARKLVTEAKAIAISQGLPLDHTRDLAAIAAETAAAEGNAEAALAEYTDFQARFPRQQHAALTRLSIDMSRARTFAALKRWTEVQASLSTWITDVLPQGQQIPVHMKGELLLLAGEAALSARAPDAARWLGEATAILQGNDVPSSARLERARRLSQRANEGK